LSNDLKDPLLRHDTIDPYQDGAIIASIALQSGCPLETRRHALAGCDEGPFSVALDLIQGR
jgi:hypothetical protein